MSLQPPQVLLYLPTGQMLTPALWWLIPVRSLLMSCTAMVFRLFNSGYHDASFTSRRLIATASCYKLRFGAGVQVTVCSCVLLPSRRLQVSRCQPQMCPA